MTEDELNKIWIEIEDANDLDALKILIYIGRHANTLPEIYHTDDNLLKSCQNLAWVANTGKDRLYFELYSESLIVSGVLFLLLQELNLMSALTISKLDPEWFLTRRDLSRYLSVRRNSTLKEALHKCTRNAREFLNV